MGASSSPHSPSHASRTPCCCWVSVVDHTRALMYHGRAPLWCPCGVSCFAHVLVRVGAGPDLRGHRLSELRLWAVGRSADDVYDNRESYLKLAEKRKRLAFKIRATEGRPIGDSDLASALVT